MSTRGRGTYNHLLAVAKKKPALQRIIENLSEYTEKEIMAIKGQPGWVKRVLVKQQAHIVRREAGYLTPEEIAALMMKKSNDNQS